MMRNAIATLILVVFDCVFAVAAIAQVTENGRIATYIVPPARAGAGIDYANAKPLPLPLANIPPAPQSQTIRTAPDPLLLFGNPQVLPGSVGSGKEQPIQLAPPKKLQQQDGAPPEFGTVNLPYTTSRVNAEGDYTAKYSPFRAAGKLFITSGFFNTSSCSASLIDRGIVVTAAHCVVKHGTREFFSTAEYIPAYDNGTAPYGKWEVASARVLDAYINGTDHCAQAGVICSDDIAILTLRPKNGSFAGDSTGWFGIGYDGYGFTTSGQALIDQLGYPGNLDGGELMERNDAQGSISAELSGNTVIGSLMSKGSSGGPWLVNLGVPPTPSPVTAAPNIVGVASWGSTAPEVQRQGASPFTRTNVVELLIASCHATPDACRK